MVSYSKIIASLECYRDSMILSDEEKLLVDDIISMFNDDDALEKSEAIVYGKYYE
jgi:hypothetical protein